jgi:8-oxo-dGTP pyrophosphatase MutT (NUDIX family)
MIVNNTKYSIEIIDLIRKWQPFKNWILNFNKNGCKISKLILQGAILKNSDTLYSALIEVIFYTPENYQLVRSLLLRGSGCVIVPYFYKEDEINFILVKQRRIQSGDYSFEFPSGKIEEFFEPKISASLELSEETGINVQPERLCLLAEDIVVCESAFDELVTWYSCEISENDYLQNLNRHHGIREEGEHITIHALNFDALKEINSFQVKTALQLLSEKKIIDFSAMKN